MARKPLSELIKSVDKTPTSRVLTYRGDEYEYFATELTMAQRGRVKAAQRDENDINEYGLKLLISKALKKDGTRMFSDAQYAELKNEWPINELEKAILSLLGLGETPEEDEEEADPKK